MALTPQKVDGAAETQVGVTSAEASIKVADVRQRFQNPKAYSYDNLGTRDGFITNFDPETTLALSGEVADSNADLSTALASAFNAAITIANAITTFAGITVTQFFLDDCEIAQARAPQFKTFSANYTALPEVATA